MSRAIPKGVLIYSELFDGPASNKATDKFVCVDNLLATTDPAEPAPTTMKSKLFSFKNIFN